MERRQLQQRREGQLRRVLGDPLPGETAEQLDRIGEASVLRAEQGLVAVMGEEGSISYRPLDDLLRHDMHSRTTAERVEVGWLRERWECRRKGQDAPSIPPHLGWPSENAVKAKLVEDRFPRPRVNKDGFCSVQKRGLRCFAHPSPMAP
jgi:hypothetical protein